MSVVSTITATNISTTGTTINYTLGSFASNIYLYRFQATVVSNPLTVAGTLVQTVVPGTTSGSFTDTSLTSNLPYAYAFYNGNVTGSATPYNPFVHLKTYVDVNYVNANALTDTSTEISNTLSNTLSSQITCYLYRYSSITSIPTAPTILDTSTGTYLTSYNVAQGTNVSPTTTLVSYTDTTLSNISYTYAYYNGQSNGTSTILSNISAVPQSDSTITFATVDTSSMLLSIITNTLARLNYTIRNNLPNMPTNTYLFRFAASSAPISDPTSGVQIGGAIFTIGDGGVGISSTPINATGLTANTQYTFAFFNGTSSSATILRNDTRTVQSVTFSTTNILNTSLTASSVTPVSAIINYTLSNTPSIIGTTVYLYRFTGNNSAPTTLTGGTTRTSVALTANKAAFDSSFSDTGLTINNSYTYAFYDGSGSAINKILTTDGSTSISVSINTTVTTVAFTATTNIFNTFATINYTLTNTSSTTIPSYLYRFTRATAPALLTAAGTFDVSANSIGTAVSTNDTGLTGATQYTYAFYNGQTIGTSSQITDTLGVGQSVTFKTTNLYNTSITSSNILNTQARISYILTNLGANTINATGYLYRFAGSSAPTVNPTTGTTVISVLDASNTTVNTFFDVSGLSVATQYTYAFYNGNTSSAIILTDTSLNNKSVTLTTTNIVLNTLTSSNVTTNSAQINYNVSNSTTTEAATIYLYRFTLIPSINLSGGTNIITNGVTVNGSTTLDASYNNTGLSNSIFYYAFYNGNTNGTSTILPISTGGNYITVKDFVDVSVLTAGNITTTSAVISYTLNNSLSVNVTSYLYRFNASTAPLSNPTSGGTNVTSVLTNSGNSASSTYTDLTLNENNIYTYAFYTSTDSSGTILTDISANTKSVTFITSEFLTTATSLTASNILITSATINYSITNPLSTLVTAYLYRFIGNTVPSTNPTTNGTQMISVDISANSSKNSQTFSSTGLTQNTGYSYAFYTVDNSSGTILTDFSGNPQSVDIFTDMYVRALSITYTANDYLTLNYRLGISNSVSNNTSYLYRYLGATAPSTLDTSNGTLITSIATITNTFFQNTGLQVNTQYTYAFYDGSRNGVNTIMYRGTTSGPTFPLTASTATGYTSNQVVTVFSSPTIFNTSNILSYTITNTPASTTATVYLYRYTVIPSTNLSGGTNIVIPISTINANGTLTNTAFPNTGLTASTTYYYAFYNGNTANTSSILPISGGGNYITVQTTGVTQSSMTASQISPNGATINYTIDNAANSSTATLYLYRYSGIITATTPLNTSTGTQVTSVNPSIPITLTASGSTNSSVTVTDLSSNKNYTYQFYNSNVNGSSPILSTIVTGGTNQYVYFKTYVTDISLSSSNVLNTSATLSYILSNTNNTTLTSYLYRFFGASAPATLNTSTGTSVTSIDISSGTNASPTVKTSTYLTTGLSLNTQYSYAFYNGQTNNASTILTNVSGNNVFTSFTTSNLLNTVLTTNTLTSTSVTIGYTLTNNTITKTAYLYRFLGSSAPSTLDASGTNIITNGVAVSNTPISSTNTNSSLTSNTSYTYAFYNGNTLGSSTQLTTDGTTPIQLTIFTTTNVVITVLNPTELTSSQVRINYILFNYQGSSKISYLYRFIGSSAPSILNTTTGTSITSVTTSALSGGIPGNTDSSFNNTGLNANTQYTYGYYNGNTDGTSILLTNYSGNDLTTTIYTTDESIVSSLTSSTLTNTFNTISYSATNNQPSTKSLYLYRFTSTSAPSLLSLSNNATLITNFTLTTGNTSTNSIFDDSLTLNTNYTYAFYSGDSVGISKVLTNYDGSPQVLNIATTNVFNTSLTATDISTTSATIDYIIPNTPSSSGIIVYLYRFNGLSAPTTLTTTGTYSSAILLQQITDPGGNTINAAYTDNTISPNANYTYAFYNGNIPGTNTILEDNSSTLNPVSITINSYYGIITLLSVSNTTNTSTNINYIITNDLTNPSTVYLYRFDNNISVPSTLNTSLLGANNVTTISLPADDTINSSYFDSTLSTNSQYTYAIYNGTANGSSILLTDSSNNGQSVVAITSNVYNPDLTASSISISSVTFNYTLDNILSNCDAIVYLYRFTGDYSAPSILTGGTSISGELVVAAGTSSSSTITDSTVSENNIYTYAFYSGNNDGFSVILQNNSTNLMEVSMSIYIYYDIVVTLSTSDTTYNSTIINYSIQNPLTNTTIAYLFRFDGNVSAPSPLDTNFSNATNVTNISITENTTNTSTYTDSTLNSNSTYTYALYNGTTSGSSVILTNSSNTPVQTDATTQGNLLPPVTYDVYVSTYKNTAITIHLDATDPQNSALSYTYEEPNKGLISGSGPDLLYTPTSTGADYFTYYATNIYALSSTPSTVYIDINNSNPPCFKEGSRILCFNPQEGKEEYIPIETIRKGTLVKTIKHGYVKVDMIGKSTIYNSGDSERITNRLFVCTSDQYPELFEELVLTGYHAILVDRFKDVEERARTRELLKYNYMTDDRYRLPACIDERAKPYEIEGEFIIWHVALENEDYFMNYGIYANGLLVESCSKRYLKELSKMTLID